MGAKKRQGFALMVTLSVLAVIIALTTVLLSYFEEAQDEAGSTKALIQADVYYTDIITIFQSIEDKKTLFSFLYRTALPIQDPDEKFAMVLECKALNRGVNVNWLGLSQNTERSALYNVAQNLFDFLVQEYGIQDPTRLLEILLEEITDNDNLITDTQRRLHQKKGIMSYQQFEALLARYQFEVDDENIGLVPWEKYFTFSTGADKIDAAYSSAELIAYLFEIDLSLTSEWVNSMELDRPSLQDFVEQSGGEYAQSQNVLADKTFLDATECSVSYRFAKDQYRFRFEYIQGEAKHFEFYGKQ